MKNVFLYLGVGLLFTHELDAMANHEWLVLPLTSWLSAETGQLVFVLAHIPLFAILVSLLASQRLHIRRRTEFGLCLFLVAHGVLHAAFMRHEHYAFESWLSNVLIFGGAICGLGYLVLDRRKPIT
jgi:dipeptide/tripeptide permease